MATEHERSRLECVANSFNDKSYSDLTIKCHGESFRVHKVLVCMAAPSLAAAIRHGTKETINNVIEHQQYDAATMKSVLQYIYLQDYKVEVGNTECFSENDKVVIQNEAFAATLPEPQSGSDNVATQSKAVAPSASKIMSYSRPVTEERRLNKRLIAHVRVFGLADYFGMPILKTFAAQKFMMEAAGDARIDVISFVQVVQEVQMCSAPSDKEMWDALKFVTNPRRHFLASHHGFMKDLIGCGELQDFTATVFADLVNDLDAAKCQNETLQDTIDDLDTTSPQEIDRLKDLLCPRLFFICVFCRGNNHPASRPKLEKRANPYGDPPMLWQLLCHFCDRELPLVN